ncbi:diguanylate cyclase domain-containing protein [Aliikangiella coralliicola]|uniref:Diguanylate cyclase n=1 Tax=Aliikangiella coralliicola TaxID=2592383 RepID=A0A545UFJ9_9GAMM|nr:diguanylate cyclase [Aliikangiella coralliicola]TQV88249.1 diguanylate cyclase [Aliikangiella coralliicola]
MKLAGFTVKQVIYAQGNTVIARAVEGPLSSEPDSTDDTTQSAIIKYQNTDYPSAHLNARRKHEFEILQSISSDWIIQAGGIKHHDNNLILVLEDFSSVTLAKFMQSKKLSFGERLQIACQLVSALKDVHEHHLIHRDINPKNILIDPDSLTLKLCNFAQATRLSHKQPSLNTNDLWGGFEYISPEQTGRTNLELDHRSDYYSLGITFYELFSGSLPFISNDPMTLLHGHIAHTPEPLAEIADIPESLSAIVSKLLAKSPEDRYQSSFGLQADLNRCWEEWRTEGTITGFPLASSDIPQQFCISQKLYGRDSELTTLLTSFEQSSRGYAELVLVKGYSGVGKSVLVNQLQKPVIAKRGFFITGKCDQYSRAQPYSALVQAIHPLIQQLLGETEERLAYWKERLSSELGDNAAVITELLPNVASIIGTPPALPTLPTAEAEARFHLACTQFINSLSSREHPLVIFLDDLQWADIPTLTLLEKQLSNFRESFLLIVAAYRSNEVDASHPLSQSLRDIEKTGVVKQLHLEPLKIADVERLLCESFHCSVDKTKTLAELCIEKTEGNPFFLNQFLSSLYDSGDISYNHQEGQWSWRIEKIRQQRITDNVVDLMVNKLRRLDREAQSLLSLAAHLGTQFSMRQLSSVSECDVTVTAAALWPILKSGFILPLDENFEFANDVTRLNQSRYRFLHDRVQQAAYLLTSDDTTKQLQLRIGRHLLTNSSANEREENLFTLLQALNSANSLITDPQEQAQLLALNLRAGIKVKKAVAYQAASTYLNNAKNLLPESAWQTQPEQTLSIYKELAEAEYLSGHFDAADAIYTEAAEMTPTKAARITLILVQAEQYQTQGRFNEAIKVLLAGLNYMEQQFPENELEAEKQLNTIFSTTQERLSPFTVEQLLNAEKMSDPESLLCMQLYNALAVALYLVGHFKSYAVNACRMVQLTLKHGQCELSSIAYLTYATAMAAMGEQHKRCYQMGKLAKTLSDQWENKYYRATTYQYFSSTYLHWCEPIENSYRSLAQVIKWGHEGINLVYAGYSVLFSVRNKLIKGCALAELETEITQGLAFLRKTHQTPNENYLVLSSYQALLALQGKTLSSNSLDTDTFNACDYFNGDFSTPSMDLAFYTSAMIRHAYLVDDVKLQQQFVQNLPMVSAFLPDSPSVTESTFYAALSLINISELNMDRLNQDQINQDQLNQDNLLTAQQYCDQFEQWAIHSPNNYQHKYWLIKAELACVKNDNELAMHAYSQAIDTARQAGFIQCEALTCERYAKYWMKQKQQRLAEVFVKEAYYLYSHWGANVKCALIEAQWPTLQFNRENTLLGVRGGVLPSTQNGIPADANSLDLHSLLKANQLLSQEINIGSLLKKMMEILLENAGAQQGGIVINDEDTLTLEVFGQVDSQKQAIECQLLSKKLDVTFSDAGSFLPNTLIRYVRQTQETLVLNKPVDDQRFLQDSYLQNNKPKSVLCLPIIGQGKLVAIVYLENNLTEKTFTEKHKDTLELIASQAAVSLINARYYRQLEEKVRQRTEELQLLASRDGLTGIANRREFNETLDKEWRRSLRDAHSLSLLMIDIDHFKEFNDHYGHLEGDNCIKAVAKALQTVVNRSSDLVARYGGEEFTILIIGLKKIDTIKVAQNCLNVVRALAIPHAFSKSADHVTISVGICTMPASPKAKADTLISQADVALYEAKHNGRNQFCIADV